MRDALSKPTTGKGETLTLWRERPFTVRHGGDLMRGVFDRVVIHEVGGAPARVDLIDFKTDRIEPDESNITTIAEHYRPQMQAYRDALSAMLALDRSQITCSLLLLACGKRIEV